MASGRAPALSPRGRLLGAAAALIALSGAVVGSWALIGLGWALATLLSAAYLAFFPSVALIWRRHIELEWAVRGHLEGSLIAGRPFDLHVTLRNRGPVALGRARLTLVASTPIDPPATLAFAMRARSEASAVGQGRPRAAGFWFLHGATLVVDGPLGLAEASAYFPSPLALKVLPRTSARAVPLPGRAGGAGDERAGPHALRLRGLSGELRELRDHLPGDPFKQIAWKATARTGRLMVRELERETLITHYLLVDLAPSMREGGPGRSRLDHAVELAVAYARGALDAGDRVGLVTFDAAIAAHLPPGDGPLTRGRLTERLMEALHPIDEEATELTDGELVALVARYLRHQESFDARLPAPPAIDDPAWSHIATGPSGELYDLELLGRRVQRAVDVEKKTAAPLRAGEPRPPAADPDMARLRRFCRTRGIELPPRRSPEHGRRARGLGAALEPATRGRGAQRIVIFSDLVGLDGEPLHPVTRCLAMSRRRGHRVTVLVPAREPPAAADPVVSEILAWERRRRELAARRRIEGLGVPVRALEPGEPLPLAAGFRRRQRA